ncbi:MAG: rRNA maturation RNase YbeY [Bacteroidota bacterium]
MINVRFFSEDVSFTLKHKRKTAHIIDSILESEKPKSGHVNYIFCSDKYLLKLNRTFVKHDYYTDILTFEDYDENGLLTADIFISIDRVKENAKELKESFHSELIRVIIHGILHICGYSDHLPAEKIKMREKENQYIMHFFEESST